MRMRRTADEQPEDQGAGNSQPEESEKNGRHTSPLSRPVAVLHRNQPDAALAIPHGVIHLYGLPVLKNGGVLASTWC